MNVGKAIRYMRKKHQLPIRTLAEAVGCSHVHIVNVENGKAEASSAFINKLSAYFGVNLFALAWALSDEPIPPVLLGAVKRKLSS